MQFKGVSVPLSTFAYSSTNFAGKKFGASNPQIDRRPCACGNIFSETT